MKKENSKLEQEFRLAVETANKLIEEKFKEASNKIEEAVNIAEQYGICFELNLHCFKDNGEDNYDQIIRSSYIPKTYKKWKKLLDENYELQDLMNGGPNYIDSGWEHSKVC